MARSLRWRRHWRLAAATAAVATVLVLGLGGIRVAAFTSSGGRPSPISDGDILGTVDLFDPSVVHSIEVSFDRAEYEAAVDEFATEGEKVFIQADVVIDGTPVEGVGIRLKGNSTLFGLAGSDEAGAGPGAPGLVGGMSGRASAESPEDLPWLIRFDEFVDGQTYQGHEEIAVRPGGMGATQATALNEALSLTLIGSAGEPAEQAAYTAFSVNGSDPTLRLLVQHPDDSLAADDFQYLGVLYKALSGTDGGRFAYEGEDPLAYEGSFRQVTRQNSQDLAPLIEFIRWVEESPDDEFAAALGERMDVESFARYLALHNLLLDSDDMSGPGQNYYLFYDLEMERFSVVTWDANATFSGDAGRGPYDDGGIGGWGGAVQPPDGQVPGGGQRPGGQTPEGLTLPEGATPPGGAGNRPGLLPTGPDDSGGAQAPGDLGRPPAGQADRGFGRGGHLLKERFLAVAEFRALYEEAYRDLYRQLYAEGVALDALEGWAGVLSTVEGDLIDAGTLANEVAQLRRIIEARAEALATHQVITG